MSKFDPASIPIKEQLLLFYYIIANVMIKTASIPIKEQLLL